MLQRVGRYEILEGIATGGQGRVYRAWDTVFDRVVAVKVINQTLSDDPFATLIVGESGPQCQSSSCFLEHLALATFPTALPITRGKYELIENQGEFQERVEFVAIRKSYPRCTRAGDGWVITSLEKLDTP